MRTLVQKKRFDINSLCSYARSVIVGLSLLWTNQDPSALVRCVHNKIRVLCI